jgi:hypothetical protein
MHSLLLLSCSNRRQSCLKNIFNVHTSRVRSVLKVLLLYLLHVNVKTISRIYIHALADFFLDKTADYELYKYCRLQNMLPTFLRYIYLYFSFQKGKIEIDRKKQGRFDYLDLYSYFQHADSKHWFL